VIDPRDASELEHAFDIFAREPNGGLIVTAAASTTNRESINSLATRHRLPTILAFRYMILVGGLASYGPDTFDIFRRAATYVVSSRARSQVSYLYRHPLSTS
jgi:putative tryptophan/tyrosine transport system substrate-binding protein